MLKILLVCTFLFIHAANVEADDISLHLKAIDDYALNEVNRKNTYQGTEVVIFYLGDTKFGIGFWPALDTRTPPGVHPFIALIAWTPEGWEMVGKMSPIWFDELGMYTGDDASDLENYMWYIGEELTNPLQEYLAKTGNNTVPLENWKKVLALLATVRLEGGRLEFDRSL